MQQLEERRLLSGLVSVTAPNPHVWEGDPAIFYLLISPPQPTTVTVNYRTVPGSAIEDIDYEGRSGTATIYPFQMYVGVSIGTYNDFVVDPDDTFSLEITSVSGAGIDPANATEMVTIDDRSPPGPTPSLTISPDILILEEGTDQLTDKDFVFTVTLHGNVPGGFNIDYRAEQDKPPNDPTAATPNKDFDSATGILAFTGTNGETHEIVIKVDQDWISEFTETFILKLDHAVDQHGDEVLVSHSATALGIITDDDHVEIRVSDTYTDEGDPPPPGDTFEFSVGFNSATFERDVDVQYKIEPISATPSVDYVAPPPGVQLLRIPAEQFGPAAGTYPTVTVIPDIDTEPNEAVKITILGVTYADGTAVPGFVVNRNAYDFDTAATTVTSDDFAIGTIVDDDPRVITLTTTAAMPVTEGTGSVTTVPLTLTLTAKTPAPHAFGVWVDLVNGTAVYPDDFAFFELAAPSPFKKSVLVDFAGTPGESHTIGVHISPDSVVELNEAFSAKATSIYYPNGNADITIDDTANTVPITIADDDTTLASISYWISPTWTQSEGDGTDDPVVNVSVKLSNPVDVPVWLGFTVTGSGAAPATIPALGPTGFVPSVRGVDDISGVPGSVWDPFLAEYHIVIPAGSTTGTIKVKLLSDAIVEPDEELTVTLTSLQDVPPGVGRVAGVLGVDLTNDKAKVIIDNDD